MARCYLSKEINDHNRPVNIKRVNLYAETMRSGKWAANGETIIFDSNGKLADGQHRLNAVVKANMPVEFTVVRGVAPEVFDTLDDGAQRKAQDVFYIAGIPNNVVAASIVRKYILLNRGRTSAIICGTGRDKVVTNKGVLEFYNAHADLIQSATTWARRFYSSVRLYTVAEIGAVIVYIVLDKHHPIDLPIEFFSQVFYSDKAIRTKACIALHKMITDAVFAHRPIQGRHKQRLLIKAWNDFLNGGKLSRLVVKEDEVLDFL